MLARGFMILDGNFITFFTSDSDTRLAATGNQFSKVEMAPLATALNDVQQGHKLSPRLSYVRNPLKLQFTIRLNNRLSTDKDFAKKDSTLSFCTAKMLTCV